MPGPTLPRSCGLGTHRPGAACDRHSAPLVLLYGHPALQSLQPPVDSPCSWPISARARRAPSRARTPCAAPRVGCSQQPVHGALGLLAQSVLVLHVLARYPRLVLRVETQLLRGLLALLVDAVCDGATSCALVIQSGGMTLVMRRDTECGLSMALVCSGEAPAQTSSKSITKSPWWSWRAPAMRDRMSPTGANCRRSRT